MVYNPFDLIDSRLSNMENILLDLQRNSQKKIPDPDASDLLMVPDCAKLLGLSIPTIYGKLHRRELPFMKRSGRVYFKRGEILNYLEQGRKKTIAEIEAEAHCSIANKKRSRR